MRDVAGCYFDRANFGVFPRCSCLFHTLKMPHKLAAAKTKAGPFDKDKRAEERHEV